MAKVTLDVALMQRKLLASKVGALKVIQASLEQDAKSRRPRFTSPDVQRNPRGDEYNELTVTVPTLDKEQVDKEQNYYSSRLRTLDDVVQQANYGTKVSVPANALFGWDDDVSTEGLANPDQIKVQRTLSKLLKIRKDITEALGPASRIPEAKMVEVKTATKKLTEGVEDMVASVDKITAGKLMEYYFALLHQQAAVDIVIHDTNCATEVDVPDGVLVEYE